MCTKSFPTGHRCDPRGPHTGVCAGGVWESHLWAEDKGCSSWRIQANYFRLWWVIKENWHTKKWLILRIRMSGYMFFCWPGEIPCLPGPTIKLFRDSFSLFVGIEIVVIEAMLGCSNECVGKSVVQCWRNIFFLEFFPSISLYHCFRAELLKWPQVVYSLF